MMRYNLIFAIIFMASFNGVQAQQNDPDFFVSPYLQLGSKPSATSLTVLWQTSDSVSLWKVEHKTKNSTSWSSDDNIEKSIVVAKGMETHWVYKVTFDGLISGTPFTYRLHKNGKEVFMATAMSPKKMDQPFRFAVFGDIGAGTIEAKQMANGVYSSHPDFVAIPGDIVYDYGLMSEYRKKFWPIYNAAKVDTIGVPLMRSSLFIAAVGNHDADSRDLDKFPDALAYYRYWDQPLNGPIGKEGGAYVPVLKGSNENVNAFIESVGAKYPRMTNFSFDYGNSHWTVLDADTYVDWTNKELQDWVAKDLEDSRNMTWHFVLFHHPGFNSSREHYEQQQMRLLSPVFEEGNVDVVFNGHVHNYQRSFPMHFVPDDNGTLLVGGKDNKTFKGRVINGSWKLDKMFDGKSNSKPKGVIYIVTGAGGQDLYNPEQQNDPDSWQGFTDKFISTVHTYSVVDIDGKKFILKQIDAKGVVRDSFEIIK